MKHLLYLYLLCSGFLLKSQNTTWSSFIDSVNVFSSPRVADLTGDGVKDIVIGGGLDKNYRNQAISAFDGSNGQLLWSVPARDEVFGSASFQDVNGDSVPDVFIGGRSAILKAIDGSNGQLLWEFWPSTNPGLPKDSGNLQFYSSQWVADQNGDSIMDLLVANGGDPDALPWDTIRLPGHLMVIDPVNGNVLAKAVVPDSMETYCSPVVADLNFDGNYEVIFGTGGETISGSLWVAELSDLMNNDLSSAHKLANCNGKGFIAPVSIADINSNSYLDIISVGFDGSLRVFDGMGYSLLWSLDFPGMESSAAPVLGNFTGSYLPDVVLSLYKGTTPAYSEFYQVLVDGLTGLVVKTDSLGDYQYSSSVAADLNYDGIDELVINSNSGAGLYTHDVYVIDYQLDSTYSIHSSTGANFGSSSWIGDLDGNDSIELVFAVGADVMNPVGAKGFNLHRLDLNVSPTPAGVAWGGYMGSEYDAHYNLESNNCNSAIANLITENISCNDANDGKLYFNIVGGSAPYWYQFSNGVLDSIVDSLSPSYYWARVTDSSGCRQEFFTSIQNPNSVSKYVNDVSCMGAGDGLTDISVTGCVCQFANCTFQWSNGVTTHNNPNLSPGTYHVTVTTTSGCVIVDSMTVNDGPSIIDSALISPPVCRGDTNAYIVLYPNFTSNVNYSWSNGESSHIIQWLSPDTFVVNVSYGTCYDTLKYVVLETDSFFMFSGSGDALCAGDSTGYIQLSMYWGLNNLNDVEYLCFDTNSNIDSIYNLISPGGAATFLMDSFKAPGYYGVVVTNSNGCSTDTQWLSINSPDSIDIMLTEVSANSSSSLDGKAIAQVSGGVPPYSYQWDDPMQQTTDTAFGLDSGIYNIIVTDSNSCTLSDSVYVGLLTGIEELEAQIRLFPNPSNGILNLELEGEVLTKLRLSIYNSFGQLILSDEANRLELNLQHLASDIYLVVLEAQNIRKVFHWIKQ